VVVWPESAVPFLIDESAAGQQELRAVLKGQKMLLTGAVRRSMPEAVNGIEPDYFTSILAFDGEAKVVAHYDKKHLVPGGEYLPLAWLIEPLGFRKLVNLPESFNAGFASSVIAIQGLGRVAMQICYEAIFPEALFETERPDWILNVTNDGWFGNSAGPYQHLAQLRLRAIEQGVGVVRVANTGISAIIDATGGYVVRSELGVEAVIDSQIPLAIDKTIYSQIGDFGLALLMGLFVLLASLSRRELQ
jgi:apolipoprotein N-acyltransferase